MIQLRRRTCSCSPKPTHVKVFCILQESMRDDLTKKADLIMQPETYPS